MHQRDQERPLDRTTQLRSLGRREFFTRSGFNLGAIAAASLIARDGRVAASESKAAVSRRDAPRARSVIFLNMTGAPPQLDMFDHKPRLNELHGQVVPPSLTKGERFAFIKGDARLLGSPFKFQQFGQAGMWMSEVVSPALAPIADDICMIKTVHTEQFNHAPAALFLLTGSPRAGRPSMGSWINYGIGSETSELPGFVVLTSGRGARCGADCYSAGFLPSVHQGVLLRSAGEPVLYLNNPPGIDGRIRRESLDARQALNQSEFQALGSPEIQTRIAQYELAFRMQAAVPELAAITNEPEAIHALYGTKPGMQHFGNNCLLARRLVERGVRFVQVNHGEWDLHGGSLNIKNALPRLCNETMQGVAALVLDLKQRGLLDSTLVILCGEFSRTPRMNNGGNGGPPLSKGTPGRDHWGNSMFCLLGGGGVRGGQIVGSTNSRGESPATRPVRPDNIHATIYRCLGIDPTLHILDHGGRPTPVLEDPSAIDELL